MRRVAGRYSKQRLGEGRCGVMDNLIKSHEFLSTYAWREGFIPPEVSEVLSVLNSMINEEMEEVFWK